MNVTEITIYLYTTWFDSQAPQKATENGTETITSIFNNVSSGSPLPTAEMKFHNSSASTPDSSPRPELNSPSPDQSQSCIMRALSIVSTS